MQAADKPRRRRVLMTADAVGGVWSYALDLAQELDAYQVDVLLAVLGPAPDERQRAEAARVANLQLLHRPFKLEWFQDVSEGDIRVSIEWLQQLAIEFEADLVHLNGYAYAAAAWTIPTVVVAHSCVYSWCESVYGAPPSQEYRPYWDRVAAGLRAASAVVSPTRWMLHRIRNIYGANLAQAEVIPNFTRQRIARAQKEKFVFACGRFWDPAKNLPLLQGIAPELRWPVLVAGSSQGPENTQSRGSHVTLLGQLSRNEVAEHLRRAAVFVHPALYEPFGLAVLEAASAGCALVLADIPTLRELWDGCALFVSPANERGWVECLHHLTSSETERLEWSAKAWERAQQFSPPSTTRQYINLYRRLWAQNHVPLRVETDFYEPSHQAVLPLHRF
jgi:glycogen synthase